VPEGAVEPAVSVVVPTYSRQARLQRLIEALDHQDLDDPFEVIVVDDASTDDTADVLARLASARPHLRWERQPVNGGPARARNTGWRLARAPLVAFTDDDCVPSPGWLRALLARAATADIVQGAVEPDPAQLRGAGPFSRTLRADGAVFFQTANVLYRRTVLEELDGFDERFPKAAGEDTELAYRAMAVGRRATFAPDALVHHDVSPSDLRAHVRDIGRWVDVPS
jgi:GT2 family glycosyltransferase